MQSQPLRAWRLELTTSHGPQALSPKYDMNAYMATLFEGEAWDLCWELGLAKKKYAQLSTQVPQISILHEIVKIRLHD